MGSVVAPLTGRLDAALTNFSKGFRQNGLIADELFPRVPVGRQSDKYWVFGREGQELTEKTLRAPGAVPQETRFTLSTNSYFCDSHALQSTIPAENEASYEAGNLEQDATQLNTDKILLDKEIAAAAQAVDTGVLANNVTLAGGDQFDDYGASKPGTVVEDAKSKIREAGVAANVMVIPEAVYKKLKWHPAILDRFKYTTSDTVSEAQLATYFEIGRVIIARGVKRSAAAVNSFIWGKDIVIAYVSPSPSQKDESAFKQFVWAGAPGTIGGFGVIIADHPYATAKSKIVGVDHYYGLTTVNADTAYVIKSAVS